MDDMCFNCRIRPPVASYLQQRKEGNGKKARLVTYCSRNVLCDPCAKTLKDRGFELTLLSK